MTIVCLPNADFIKSMTISKPDYIIPYSDCQIENYKNTIEYNYIKMEDLIESNKQKYQDIFW